MIAFKRLIHCSSTHLGMFDCLSVITNPSLLLDQSQSTIHTVDFGGVLRWACMSVCLCVCPRSYLQNYASDLQQIFCPCWLWPRLGPALTALRYVMYFRFFISAHNAGLWVWQPATGGYSYRRMIINDWSLQPHICMWHISVSLLTPTIWHSQLFLCCWNIVFKSINCITVDILSRYIDNSTS